MEPGAPPNRADNIGRHLVGAEQGLQSRRPAISVGSMFQINWELFFLQRKPGPATLSSPCDPSAVHSVVLSPLLVTKFFAAMLDLQPTFT